MPSESTLVHVFSRGREEALTVVGSMYLKLPVVMVDARRDWTGREEI